jgi:hypothetical protein
MSLLLAGSLLPGPGAQLMGTPATDATAQPEGAKAEEYGLPPKALSIDMLMPMLAEGVAKVEGLTDGQRHGRANHL